MSLIALALGIVIALGSFALAGRLVGFCVAALWSAGTAYFLMTPLYSFRVSKSEDIAALAVYGAVGMVLAKMVPTTRRTASRQERPAVALPRALFFDPAAVLAAVTSSPEVASRLKERSIQFDTSYLTSWRCSHADGVRVLSDVLETVLADPELRRVSLDLARKPGVDVLYVTAHRVWPPPQQRSITIGRRDEDCSKASFRHWPQHVSATWFDNGNGRVYQISFHAALNATSGEEPRRPGKQIRRFRNRLQPAGEHL
jgi:hypothetical protein